MLHFVNLLHQQLLGDKMRHVGENLLHEGQPTRDGHLALHHAIESCLGDDGGRNHVLKELGILHVTGAGETTVHSTRQQRRDSDTRAFCLIPDGIGK